MHAPVRIQEDRIAALLGIAVALVEQRRPGVVELVDLDPCLHGHGAGQLQVGARLQRNRLQAVELQSTAQLPRGPARLHAVCHARRDAALGVDHRKQREAVVGATRGVGPSLDQQRVDTVLRQRDRAAVGAQVCQAGDLVPQGIEDSPVGVAAIEQAVEIHALAGTGGELVGVGLARRVEPRVDSRTQRQRSCLGQVDQAEAVGARGVAHTIDAQVVIACRKIHCDAAAEVDRVGPRKGPVRHQVAAGPAQRPVDVVVVGQRVEHHAQVVGQSEGIPVGFAGHVQGGVDARAHRVGR